MSPTFYIKYIIFLMTIYSASATINPTMKYQSKKYENLRSGPQLQNVFERKLINKEPLVNDIVIENNAYYKNTAKNIRGKIMAYVAPWDYAAFEVSKIWAKKFDILAPVWYRIHRVESMYKIVQFDGYSGFNDNWLRDMRILGETNNKILEVYPRFMFDQFSKVDFTSLFSFKSERIALNKLIVNICREKNFDGIVLEIWHELAGRVYDNHLYNLVISLAEDLKAEGFSLTLPIPAWHNDTISLFTQENFDKLYSHIDYFVIKTYEFSDLARPGPNAPFPWIRKSVENIVPTSVANYKLKRQKILIGMNLYGYDYTPDGGHHINGKKYLNLIKYSKNRLKFDDISVENFFVISKSDGRHTVFYPTLYSINERVRLAEELGVGVALVDLGQGLNYFYDLF